MLREKTQAIVQEIDQVLRGVEDAHVDAFIRSILDARHLVVTGAGRIGMAGRAFAMRLRHLGLDAYALGDATVPHIGPGDLLIVGSGSGETQTVYEVQRIAKENGARIALITGDPDSRMGKNADVVVVLPAPSKTKTVEGLASIQPMTTLNEQCLGILFDAITLVLMERMRQSGEDMWARHSNLE